MLLLKKTSSHVTSKTFYSVSFAVSFSKYIITANALFFEPLFNKGFLPSVTLILLIQDMSSGF